MNEAFYTSCLKHIFETDVLETGMIDQYLVHEIRKISHLWRLDRKGEAKDSLRRSRNQPFH